MHKTDNGGKRKGGEAYADYGRADWAREPCADGIQSWLYDWPRQ